MKSRVNLFSCSVTVRPRAQEAIAPVDIAASTRQGRELHIIWDSGEYSILSETERGYTYKIVDSGEVIEDATPAVSAIRTSDSQVPSAWLESYLAEREVTSGGIAFTSRKSARAFYRGNWIIRRSETVLNALASSALAGSPHQLIAH